MRSRALPGHWKGTCTASVKLLVGVGFWSRYQAVKFQVSPGWMATGGVSGRAPMSTAIVISPAAPEFWTCELNRPMGAARHSTP